MAHWSDAENGDTLSVLLPKFASCGILPRQSGKDGFALPQSWQDQIVSKFERLEVSPFPEQSSPALHDRSPTTWHDRCLPKYNALLEVLESTVVHPSTNARISEILLRKLKLALRPSSSLAPEEANFIVGRGFIAFSKMSKAAGEVDKTLQPLLHAAAPRYARLPNFLEALLQYEAGLKSSPTPKATHSTNSPTALGGDVLITALTSNLCTDSHDLRLLSLRLLDHLYTIGHESSSEALTTMIIAEQTPLDLQTIRSVSMHVRKLATIYALQPTVLWMRPTIISFCFGMLTIKFAQLWDDASASLKQISEYKIGEEEVARIAFDWLETPSITPSGLRQNNIQTPNNGLTDFECSNMINLELMGKKAEFGVVHARDTMLQKFAAAQQLVVARPPSARTQALRVLSATPAIAEKRSRQLVPMFLSWAGEQEEEVGKDDETEQSGPSNWTRKDQKTLLDIFSLFVNPKSLYKSDEVYKALLQLLTNGDIEIQKSALKAIFAWKNNSIKPYEENLLNLLDEARFKDEIGILLQGQTLVQPDHRQDLVPILLRILYGRSISRKGAASGRQGMEARRLMILRNLSPEDVEGFLDIALGELKDVRIFEHGVFRSSQYEKEVLGVRKQVGFTHMIEGVLKELGPKAKTSAQKLIDAVLYCVIYTSRKLADEPEEGEDSASDTTQTSLLKDVRQTGLKCLNLLFANAPDFSWTRYIGALNNEVISAKLENLPVETAQGISIILRIFWTWSASSTLAVFLASNDQIMPKIAECLAPKKSKDEVKLFALNILRNLLRLARDENGSNSSSQIQELLLNTNMDHFLIHIGGVLCGHYDLSKELLEACVDTVSELAPFVSTSSQARNLVDVSIFLLNQPSRRVSPKTKGGLLLVLEHFVPLYDLQDDDGLKDKVYNTITSLFGFFKDKTSREVLSRVLLIYSKKDPVIGDVATICIDLNSFLENRLDEPDYDRRLKAFNITNSSRENPFTAHQWLPILYNMLFYVRHDEEFGILSSNSADCICKFIDSAGETQDESEQVQFQSIVSAILMPALFSGVREPSEIVRREYLKVMAHLIRTFPESAEVSDMHILLAGEDEIESSFFNNIIAAGKGRQSSALVQLSAAAERGEFGSKNVSHFFIPLIEHFIFDRAEGNDAHNLAAEATNAVGVLARFLEWPQYRALVRRFIGYVEAKPELEKQIIRLLGKVTDALALAVEESKSANVDVQAEPKMKCTLAITIPGKEKLAEDLTTNILPPLSTSSMARMNQL